MRKLILSLALFVGGAATAGVVRPLDIGGGTFTQPSAPRSYSLSSAILQQSNDLVVNIQVLDSAGRPLHPITVFVPADTTKPVTDDLGNVLAATVPSAIDTARTSLTTALKNAIANAAAAGKFNR